MSESAIHPSAIVEDGARLGDKVSVGPFSYVQAGAELGDGCEIGPHVTLLSAVTLGRGCRVHAGAVLGDLPQDMGFQGGSSRVVIGERCVLREGVTIHRGTKEGTRTVVGDGCFLMSFSHLAHNVRLGEGVIVANGALLAGYVEVGDRAFVSGNVCVHQFVHVGRLAMLGGNCGVSKDVPPFCTVRPVALNRVAGLNIVGMRRAGFDEAQRRDVKKAFDTLYRSGLNTHQALHALDRAFPAGPGREIHDFVAASMRGICAFRAAGEETSEQ